MIRKIIFIILLLFLLTIVDISITSVFKFSLPLIFITTYLLYQEPPIFVSGIIASGIILDLAYGTIQGEYIFAIIIASLLVYLLRNIVSLKKYLILLIFLFVFSIMLYPFTKNIKAISIYFVCNTIVSFLVLAILRLFTKKRIETYEERT